MKRHVKALLFDFGGVLSLPQDEVCVGKMAGMCGVHVDVFNQAYSAGRLRLDRGDITSDEYYTAMLAGFGVDDAEASALIPLLLDLDVDSWSRENSFIASWVGRLKAAGYPRGILSNMPAFCLPIFKERMSVLSLFDSTVFSCDVGLVKPEPAIYGVAFDALAAAAGLTLTPEDVLYLDDMEVNVKAALRLGFRGIVYTDPRSLRLSLKDYDLPEEAMP